MSVPSRSIVIPTWRGHFGENLRFLRSFRRRLKDAGTMPLTFVVSDAAEAAELETLLRAGGFRRRLRLQVASIQDLLPRFGVSADQAARFKVSAFANKFSYQSIKKLFGVLASDADQTLVLDSEAFILKPGRIHDYFDRYFSAPFILVSPLRADLLARFNRASASLIDPGFEHPEISQSWIFEYPAWFFEKSIVREFAAAVTRIHGRPIFEVMRDTADIFEVIGYHWFIRLNADKYPAYRWIDIPELVRSHFPPALAERYLAGYATFPAGILEHLMLGLDRENYPHLLRLVDAMKFDFIRFENHHAGGNLRLARRFVAASAAARALGCSDGIDQFVRSRSAAVIAAWLSRARIWGGGIKARLRSA